MYHKHEQECEHDHRRVELAAPLGEGAGGRSAQHGEELATQGELQQQVEVGLILRHVTRRHMRARRSEEETTSERHPAVEE